MHAFDINFEFAEPHHALKIYNLILMQEYRNLEKTHILKEKQYLQKQDPTMYRIQDQVTRSYNVGNQTTSVFAVFHRL